MNPTPEYLGGEYSGVITVTGAWLCISYVLMLFKSQATMAKGLFAANFIFLNSLFPLQIYNSSLSY